MKRIIPIVCLVALTLCVSGCEPYKPKPSPVKPDPVTPTPDPTPDPTPASNFTPIKTVRALYNGSDVKIGENVKVKGMIISNYRHSDKGGLNNATSQKTIVVADSEAGIQLYCTENNTLFGLGDEVEVDLSGQTLSVYQEGALQINGLPLSKIIRTTTGGKPVARKITAAQLMTGGYESTYVEIPDVQVKATDLGKTFVMNNSHTSICMEAATGEEFDIFSSAYSSFGKTVVPSGSGTLRGIAGKFGQRIQISVTTESDFAGLTGPRKLAGPVFCFSGDTTADVDGDKGEYTLLLLSTSDWTAESLTEGFTVSPTSGKASDNPQEIKIGYTQNPRTDHDREGRIQFKASDASITPNTIVFTLFQDPYKPLVSDEVEAWMELPEVKAQDGFVYVHHDFTLNGKKQRNYSLWYDTNSKVALWAAYPMTSYTQTVSRTDKWAYDPKIPEKYQGTAFRGYGLDGYGRGHQVPSGDRLHNREANEQTFYFTNMTPQLSDLNGKAWSTLEGKIRNWSGSCDTLYVVTGCLVTTEKDKEITWTSDNDGKPLAIPKAYFKVVLRYNKANTANNGYDAIGFYFEHKASSRSNIIAKDAMTVADLEKITGFNFFHNLPDSIEAAVEGSVVPKDWGLQ